MKMITKAAMTISSIAVLSSSVFAQSLADAKLAINAEQYEKAETMLKNLTNTQASKDENFFYLGWLYIKKDYPDSAKAAFNKGISVNPRSALNYAGLGIVERINKNNSGAQADFDKAISFIDKKDNEPYVYIGRGYLQGDKPDANAAIQIIQKGIAANPKDKNPELYSALGDAYRSQLKNTEAYDAYSQALAINPKMVSAIVATGVIWKQANNYEDSEKEYRRALAIDPNYGPAYRELAETYLRWGTNSPHAVALEKFKQAEDFYKKYLDLTDMSVDSRMRYADFLVYAQDYKTLQQQATEIAKMAGNSNLKVYRYIGYAAYENGNYKDGLDAMNKFVSSADPSRLIPIDYLYLGRLQIKNDQDSLGIISLKKSIEMDSTLSDARAEIGKAYYAQKKYEKAGDAYAKYIQTSHNVTLNDYLTEGRSYYFAYGETPKGAKPDSTLLIKADSAFNYIAQKTLAKPVPAVLVYQARVANLEEPNREMIKGNAKPYYEKIIEVMGAPGTTPSDQDKKFLAEAYSYLGSYYAYAVKDAAKAQENFSKALEYDPTDSQAKNYMASKKSK